MNAKNYLPRFTDVKTPFYFYDVDLLRSTLNKVTAEAAKYGYKIHYAMKANFSRRIMAEMKRCGIGADCVSGGEIRRAIESGIPASEIVFAGVAKSDAEIVYALENDIFSFNCESREELQVINSLARKMGKRARVALRINPDVDPMTHKYISTGKADNKFGISYTEIDEVIAELADMTNISIVGIHFHIGSQITEMRVFEELASKANTIQEWFTGRGFNLSHINLGGGLGINYADPDSEPMPDFEKYFSIFHRNLKLRPGQIVHFELGRSIVGQSGELITRVLYNKVTGSGLNVVLVDAGMTDLIRPALYQASHKIENLTSKSSEKEVYTVGGPICESSDIFARSIELPKTVRGDILSLRSAGAYGRVMASNYNLREFPAEYFSDEI